MTTPSLRFHGAFRPTASALPGATAKISEGLHSPRFLKAFDFENVGKTILRQSQVFYATSIVTRLIAGTMRSAQEANQLYPGDKKAKWKNLSEPREHALRDIGSFFIFYFVSPLVQRVLMRVSPYRDLLIEKIKPGASWKQKLKMQISGPFVAIDQLKDREKWEKALAETLHQNGTLDAAALAEKHREITRLFSAARTWHHVSYLAGLGVVLVSIGIGVGKLNIYLAKRDLARRKQIWEVASQKAAAAQYQGDDFLKRESADLHPAAPGRSTP